jgi:hypothetical protein
MMICEYCRKNQATHFCSTCGHWVCNSPLCELRAGAKGLQNGAKKIAQSVNQKLTRSS